MVFSLKAGANAIKFSGPGANGRSNFDRIEIRKVPRSGGCSPGLPNALDPVYDLIQNLELNPNPVNESTTMTFKSANNANGKLSVYTLTGKLVFEDSYHFTVGANQKEIDLSILNKGLYIGKLQLGGEMQSVKIMKK